MKMSPPICQGGFCQGGDAEGLFYVDSNHLSPRGARHFSDTFRPMLEAIINGRDN